MSTRHTSAIALVALSAAAALSGCGRHDAQTAGEKVDNAVAKAEQQTREARNDAQQAVNSAEQAAGKAEAKVASATSDIAITTSINAQLAHDGALDPAKIDVDTHEGRVVLRGSAPDEPAKERAKRIAMAVDGVKGVDNYLSVNHSS